MTRQLSGLRHVRHMFRPVWQWGPPLLLSLSLAACTPQGSLPVGTISPNPPTPRASGTAITANAAVERAAKRVIQAAQALSADFGWLSTALPSGRAISLDPAQIYLFPTQRQAVASHLGAAKKAISLARGYAKSIPRVCPAVAENRATVYAQAQLTAASYTAFQATLNAAYAALSRATVDRQAVQAAIANFERVAHDNPSATVNTDVATLAGGIYTPAEQAALATALHNAQLAATNNVQQAQALVVAARQIAPYCG